MSSYLSLWVPTYRGSLDVRIPFDGVQLKRRETCFVRRVQLARRTRTQAQVGLRQLSRLTLHPWTSSPQECNSHCSKANPYEQDSADSSIAHLRIFSHCFGQKHIGSSHSLSAFYQFRIPGLRLAFPRHSNLARTCHFSARHLPI